MRALSIVAGAAMLGLLGGCAAPETKLVGMWQFKDISVPNGAATPDNLQRLRNAYQSVTLAFVKDKSFVLSLPNAPIAGSWSLNGKSVQMTTQTIAGLPPEEFKKQQIGALEKVNPRLANKLKGQSSEISLAGTLGDDDKSLSVVSQGGQTGTLTFTKKAG